MARLIKPPKPPKPVIEIAKVRQQQAITAGKAKLIKGRYKKGPAAKKVQNLPVASQDVGRFKGKF